jgi:hypothetical protein
MSEESELGAVFAALSASLVAANEFLRSTTESLRDAAASDPGGRTAPVSTFAIADASFEVAFTVVRVEERPPEPPVLPLRRNVSISEREMASLLRGVSEETRVALADLIEGYELVKQLYARVREEPNRAGSMVIPARIELSDEALDELRSNASQPARSVLDRLLNDYEASRGDLVETKRIIQAGPQRRVLVRIDPEAVREAGAAVQHARLTFRIGQQELIDIDGAEVVVPD